LNDYIVRAITRNGNYRAMVGSTTELVREACERHSTYPTASVALGRALTGAALMANAGLKPDQRLALKFEGNGPLQRIIVEADYNGDVRGFIAVPDVEIPLKNGHLDVAGALGNAGLLTVSKDLGLKKPYEGIVHLYSSEIAEDLAYYLTESEQIPSAVGLGVYISPEKEIHAAGGFLIQVLPPSDDHITDRLTQQVQALPSVSDLIASGKSPEDILALIFRDIEYDILETRSIRFRCSCSEKRVERVVLSLGKAEIESLIREHGHAEVKCEYCRNVYNFTKDRLQVLLDELSKPSKP